MRSQTRIQLSGVVLLLFLLCNFAYSDLREQYIDPLTNEEVVEWINPLAIIFKGQQVAMEADGVAVYTRDFDVVYRSALLFKVLFILFFAWGLVKQLLRPSAHNDHIRSAVLILFWLSLARFIQLILTMVLLSILDLTTGSVLDNLDLLHLGFTIAMGVLSAITLKWMGNREGGNTDYKTLGVPNWNRPFYMAFDRFIIFFIVGNFFLFRFYYFSINRMLFDSGDAENLELYLYLGMFTGMLMLIKLYSITEYLFGFTPGKLLTGMHIVKTETKERISFMAAMGRAFSRFIPFENFSILSSNSWHDSFSKTELTYVGSKSWMQRQSKIVKCFGIFFLVIASWNLFIVAGVIRHEIDMRSSNHNLFDAAELPVSLIAIGAFFMMFLISGWLASVNNHFENVHDRAAQHRSGMYLEALCMWIPLVHFFLPSRINGNIRANVEVNFGETDEEAKVRRRSKLWGGFFQVFMIFFWIGLLTLLDNLGRKHAMIVASAFMGFGSVFLGIGTWIYAKAFEEVDFNPSKLILRDGEKNPFI